MEPILFASTVKQKTFYPVTKTEAEISDTSRVLLICDQPMTASIWEYILLQGGLQVKIMTSLVEAKEFMKTHKTDLIVMDLLLQPPELIAARFSTSMPILWLLPGLQEKQVVDAYTSGIDEVIIKPISPAIFLAKVNVWLQWGMFAQPSLLPPLGPGHYRLNGQRRVIVDPWEREIKLTELETRLLQVLQTRIGQVFHSESIIKAVWGGYWPGDEVLLKNLVYRLRKKIEPDPLQPALLRSWQRGYSFHP